MIKLYQFPPALGLPNISPFCMKVETYLRMVDLEFERVSEFNPASGPKKKLPYIVDSGRAVPDSGFIIDYLKQTYGDKLDAELSDAQWAVGHLIRRTLEESFYFALLYSRWVDDRGWKQFRPGVFGGMPAPVRAVVPLLARRNTTKNLESQGFGRHNAQEVYQLGRDDLTAIARMLGDNRYILGEKPSSFDATAYAFLGNLLLAPLSSSLKEHALGFDNLPAYVDRLKAEYYS